MTPATLNPSRWTSVTMLAVVTACVDLPDDPPSNDASGTVPLEQSFDRWVVEDFYEVAAERWEAGAALPEMPGYAHEELDAIDPATYGGFEVPLPDDHAYNALTFAGVTLMAGDVLLGRYRDDNRACTWASVPAPAAPGYWCHAAMVIDGINGGNVIEAPGLGQANKVTPLLAFRDHYKGGRVAVLRARSGAARQAAANRAYSRRGIGYWPGAPKWSPLINYCSQLVWYSYDSTSGLDLDRNGGLIVFPDDLSTDGDLFLVGFIE